MSSLKDQFEIAYSDYGNQNAATAYSFVSLSPALTPRSTPSLVISIGLTNHSDKGGNPAFKMYEIDPDTFEIVDLKVYTSKRRSIILMAGHVC